MRSRNSFTGPVPLLGRNEVEERDPDRIVDLEANVLSVAHLNQVPIEALVEHAGERGGDGALARREHGVEPVAVGLFQVFDDEDRVTDRPAAILDHRKLSLRRLGEVALREFFQLVRQAGHPQIAVDLADERAHVGQAPGGM
jgi:hypothetical protein